MKNKKELLVLIFIFVLFFGLRVIPLFSNAFYFTADQGWNAIHVRDIVVNRHIVWQGPETTVRGLFAGPLWYYFVAIGYFITLGHPAGGVLILIILNGGLLLVLYNYFKKFLGINNSLFLITVLSLFWPFYDSSRYSFNPFPTVTLAFFLIIDLIRKKYWRGLVWIFLAFNCNLAITVMFFIFHYLVGLIFSIKNEINRKYFGVYSLPILLAVIYFLIKHSTGLFFLGINISPVVQRFGEIVRLSIVPQSNIISAIILGVVAVLFLINKKQLPTITKQWVYLWVTLFVVSFGFLCFSKIQRDWYTVFLAPGIFVSIMLILLGSKSRIKYLILGVILGSQLIAFVKSYNQYLKVNIEDKGILANQITTIDWIYNHSDNNGFNVYNYTDSYFDYGYQYLFWWYGLKKYKYLPCEYSNLPFSDKSNYVRLATAFSRPTRGCDQNLFLIIDSTTNGETNFGWLKNFQEVTKLKDTKNIGKIVIEKREITEQYKEYYSKNLIFRHYIEMGMEIDIPENWESKREDGKISFSNKDSTFTVNILRFNKKCGIKPYIRRSGKVNDLGLTFSLKLPMIGAKELFDKIISSFKVVEDEKAMVAKNCFQF